MKQIYHLWNRGVDGRPIVIDDNDRYRFMMALEKFNSMDPVRLNHHEADKVAPLN